MPRRIVLVSVDTLRFDAFSPETMPRARAFFERGQIFNRFYSATSTTQPTHASLHTGQHPWEHGVVRNGLVLSEDHDTLAEALQDLGYYTMAVTASFPVKGEMGYSQGFDAFNDAFAEKYVEAWQGFKVPSAAFYSLAEDTVTRTNALLDAAPEGDQFLWLHLFDPHDPYGDATENTDDPVLQLPYLRMISAKHSEHFERWLGVAIDQYRRDVASMDEWLGKLLARLEAESGSYETLIVLTADHGESLGEGGSIGHGDRLHSPAVHVPLAILGPGWAPGVREDIAGTVDVTETVLVWAGAPSGLTRGRDLSKEIENATALGMRRIPEGSKVELRTDGTKHDQTQPLFYVVHDGSLLCGREGEVRFADHPERDVPEELEPLNALFAAFASQLQGREAKALEGQDVDRALDALGY